MIDNLSVPNPPHYFKLVSLENLYPNKKIVEIVIPDWPVNLMNDSCATNVCASRDISEQLGLLSPSIRCTSYAADGIIKRISTSKTRNVPAFSTVMCHFQLSRKSLALLNEALKVMDMKEVHLMTFYPTRMAYLLTACSQAVHLLLPICDVIRSADLKTEGRSSFMSLKSMIIMHVLADMEELLLQKFLLLDGDNSLIIEYHHVCVNLMKF